MLMLKLHREILHADGLFKNIVFCRFLATGDSLQTISFSYRVGHSTVLYIVRETCQALWKCLANEVMRVPDEKDWKMIADSFR
jgi:hypothetical protein